MNTSTHRDHRPHRSALAIAASALLALPVAALADFSQSSVQVIPPSNAPATPPNHVRDVNFMAPGSDGTPIYRVCTDPHLPIPAGANCPEGTEYPILAPTPSTMQLTWGEWRTITGYVRAKCINGGTHFDVHVSDALPHAVYTIWMVVIGAMPPTAADASGARNVFTTSETGEGQVSFTRPGDDSSPRFPSCALNSTLPVHFLFAYHSDGNTYGQVPGDASVHALQAYSAVVP